MKNLKNYGVIEISKTESSQINGGDGGWLYKLGAAAHSAWCSVKGTLNDIVISQPSREFIW